MNKLTLFVVGAMMAAGLTSFAQAGVAPAALAEISPLGCTTPPTIASWDWAAITDTPTQTQFGGDAKITVEASIDGGATWTTFDLKFGLERDPDTPDTDNPGMLVYNCTTTEVGPYVPVETAPTGTCTATFLDPEIAIQAAIAGLMSTPDVQVTPEDVELSNPVLTGLLVKAMNPPGIVVEGEKASKRQDYLLVDVCNVPINNGEEE